MPNDNGNMAGEKRVIAFSPHPDDETLGCGGTIAKKVNQGYEVFVVFMTDGRHAYAKIGVPFSPLSLSAIRQVEAKRAMKILGLKEENLLFLDFEDRTLGKNEKPVGECVSKILKDLSPAEVFFPQPNEYHVDHRATYFALKRAIEALGLHSIEYQYFITRSFPFCMLPIRINETFSDPIFSTFLKRKIIRMDISEFLELKIKALAEYKSQIAPPLGRRGRWILNPSLLKRALKTDEQFFVNPRSI